MTREHNILDPIHAVNTINLKEICRVHRNPPMTFKVVDKNPNIMRIRLADKSEIELVSTRSPRTSRANADPGDFSPIPGHWIVSMSHLAATLKMPISNVSTSMDSLTGQPVAGWLQLTNLEEQHCITRDCVIERSYVKVWVSLVGVTLFLDGVRAHDVRARIWMLHRFLEWWQALERAETARYGANVTPDTSDPRVAKFCKQRQARLEQRASTAAVRQRRAANGDERPLDIVGAYVSENSDDLDIELEDGTKVNLVSLPETGTGKTTWGISANDILAATDVTRNALEYHRSRKALVENTDWLTASIPGQLCTIWFLRPSMEILFNRPKPDAQRARRRRIQMTALSHFWKMLDTTNLDLDRIYDMVTMGPLSTDVLEAELLSPEEVQKLEI